MPVGSHTFLFASQLLQDATIYISSPLEGKTYNARLFNGSHLIYKDSFGGLKRNWHNVVDCGIQTGVFHSKIYNFLNPYVGKNFEFVPFIKRKNIIKKNRFDILPKARKILDIGDTIKVQFYDGSSRVFDYVFICHGALPIDDILVNSGLATCSNFVSDHLLLQSNEIFKSSDIYETRQIRLGLNGFVRSYKKFKVGDLMVKETIRRHFGASPETVSASAIYAENNKELLKQLIKISSFSSIFNATALRYGFPQTSEHCYKFYQVAINDLYKNTYNNELSVNSDKLRLIECIRHELNCKNTFYSGIHYHNTYSSLENEVNNLGHGNSKLVLLSPQKDYYPSCHHFTADLMRRSEDFILKIKRDF